MSLDTNVVVDFTRGDSSVTARWRAALARREELVISAVALEELAFGAAISAAPEQERRELEVALRFMRIEPLTETDAWRVAEYRSRQKRAGKPLSAYNGLIAGHAHVRGWSLATSDAKLIDGALDLDIQNWREPA